MTQMGRPPGRPRPEYRHVGSNPYYQMWSSMVERCTKPNHKAYDRYGGRGITVDECWLQHFDCFMDQILGRIGPKPEGYQLDRIDNDKGYYLDNVQWSTPKEQSNNRQTHKRWRVIDEDELQQLWHQGMSYKDMQEHFGISEGALLRRLAKYGLRRRKT